MQEPADIIQWIEDNRLVNEKGKPLEFYNRPFLKDIYRDFSPRQVIKKCAQIGFSVTTVIKDIYLAYFRNYTIIYTLPTREMVFEHVPTKVDVIIDKNPILQQMVVSKDSSTQKKRCGDGFVLYKGTFGEREAIMTSSDLNTYDECDRSNQDTISSLESRLEASDFKGQWWFSNPTYPNVGVCRLFDQSDQKMWHIKCRSCGKEILLDWHTCIDPERGVYACPHCHGVITDDDRRGGFWVPHYPDREISGYHISHVMAPWISATEMLRREQEKAPDIFHNYNLGEGYMDGTKTVTRDILERCEAKYDVEPNEYLAVGIDQGMKLHCTIGPRHGISRLVVLDTWEQVDQLISSDRVRSVVIDAQPERRDAAALAKKYPYKVFNCFYIEDAKRPGDLDPIVWNESEGIVQAERTATIDDTVRRLATNSINIYLDPLGELYKRSKREKDTFLAHWEAMYVVELDDRHGNRVRRWEHSGPDHWAHSTNYWNIASKRLPRIRLVKKPKNDVVQQFQPRNKYTGY